MGQLGSTLMPAGTQGSARVHSWAKEVGAEQGRLKKDRLRGPTAAHPKAPCKGGPLNSWWATCPPASQGELRGARDVQCGQTEAENTP